MGMAAIRHALTTRRGWLAWACALALAVRMLVPTGYMPARIAGAPAFRLCPDAAPQAAMSMPMAGMPAMAGKHHDHDKHSSGSCPFAIAAMASLAGADAAAILPPLLAIFAAVSLPRRAAPIFKQARLRPPSQAPPPR